MKLLKPVGYRLKPAQDAWLMKRAEQSGHGNKALELRLIIDREMLKSRSRSGRKRSGNGRAAA